MKFIGFLKAIKLFLKTILEVFERIERMIVNEWRINYNTQSKAFTVVDNIFIYNLFSPFLIKTIPHITFTYSNLIYYSRQGVEILFLLKHFFITK